MTHTVEVPHHWQPVAYNLDDQPITWACSAQFYRLNAHVYRSDDGVPPPEEACFTVITESKEEG